jgi:Fur family ferric uptake transcriptional regulator
MRASQGAHTVTDEIERLLRDRGAKFTRQRRVILAELEKAAGHPTADEVYERVKQQKVSKATVYRTMAEFVRLGVVKQLHFPKDDTMRFELAGSARHDHLVDAHTGQITEFENPEIARHIERMAARLGYQLTSYKLELIGERMKRNRR